MSQVERWMQKLSAHRVRMTEQRRLMLEIFARASTKLTPKQMYQQMSAHYPGLSFDTVYRNIRLLRNLGIIEALGYGDQLGYRLHCEHEGHHHHFQCVVCAKTTPIAYCPLECSLPLPEHYQVLEHVFEVRGVCAECGQQKS